MANENLRFTNQEDNLGQNFRQEEKKTPNIRTMGSDVSAYAKIKQLSQVSVAAEELKREEKTPEFETELPSRRAPIALVAAFGALAIIAVTAAAGVYVYYTKFAKPGPEEIKPSAPIYFSTEKTETISVAPQDNAILKLNGSAVTDIQPDNSVKRLSFVLTNEKETETPASAKDFFRILHIPAPSLIAGDADIMPFFSYQSGVARAGLLVPIRDNNAALQTMLLWEASIQKDLSPLFLQELPETAAAPFEDKLFKNINYRFVKLSHAKDFGIGYFIFPSKHYLIIATSENSLQTVITRLFEAQ